MPSLDTLSLKRSVLHIVDPHGEGGFQVSGRELPLQGSTGVESFLKAHIVHSLEDSAAQAAVFDRKRQSSPLREIIEQLRRKPAALLKASQNIARHLHSIVQNDRRISGAALAVCEYEVDANTALAILKLDPSRAFRPKIQKDSKGVSYVGLEPIQNIIPTKGERLQKCAFIYLHSAEDLDYDMMVLDRQQARGEEPARFFTEQFLGATAYLDDRELTKRFYDTVVASYNVLRPTLSTADADTLRSSLDEILHQEKINVKQWVDSRRLPSETKEVLRAELAKNLPNKAFNIDPETAQRLTRIRKFRGDAGFQLIVSADDYDQVVKQITVSNEDSNYAELILDVTGFQEILEPSRALPPMDYSATRLPSSRLTKRVPHQPKWWLAGRDVSAIEKTAELELGIEIPVPDWLPTRIDNPWLSISLTCPNAAVSPEVQTFHAYTPGPRYFHILPLIHVLPRNAQTITVHLTVFLQREAIFLNEYDIDIPINATK